jgi:hypothetical protein
LISKILLGRKTSEVIKKADESSFGEGQVNICATKPKYSFKFLPVNHDVIEIIGGRLILRGRMPFPLWVGSGDTRL